MRYANNRSGVTQVAKSNEVSSVSPHQGTEDGNETDSVAGRDRAGPGAAPGYANVIGCPRPDR